jgi:hypothetical protein
VTLVAALLYLNLVYLVARVNVMLLYTVIIEAKCLFLNVALPAVTCRALDSFAVCQRSVILVIETLASIIIFANKYSN